MKTNQNESNPIKGGGDSFIHLFPRTIIFLERFLVLNFDRSWCCCDRNRWWWRSVTTMTTASVNKIMNENNNNNNNNNSSHHTPQKATLFNTTIQEQHFLQQLDCYWPRVLQCWSEMLPIERYQLELRPRLLQWRLI